MFMNRLRSENTPKLVLKSSTHRRQAPFSPGTRPLGGYAILNGQHKHVYKQPTPSGVSSWCVFTHVHGYKTNMCERPGSRVSGGTQTGEVKDSALTHDRNHRCKWSYNSKVEIVNPDQKKR